MAEKYFGENRSKKDISKKTGIPYKALDEIVKRGEKAYYTSGSRPNVSPEQWGIARMYAVLFGSKGARRADADIVKKFNIPIITEMKGKGNKRVIANATPDEITEEKKYPENYSKETQDTIKKALFNPNGKGLSIMGSMGLRSQKYASDYDMFEVVRVNSIDQLETRFKRIIKNLLDDPNVFIGDIKLGNIEEWRVVNENALWVDGKLEGYNAERARKRLTDLYEKGLFNKDVYENGMRLLKDDPNIMEWREILGDLRFNIVRWRPKDVLKGFTTHLAIGYGNRKYTLREALQAKSLFKLDFFALQNDGIFQEFSIIYDVRMRGRRLNLFPVNVEAKLREDMSYYAQKGEWWKFLKRFFSLTNFLLRTGRGNKGDNEQALVVLNQLLNSDLGIIANLRGDIEALASVMENEDAGLITIERGKAEVDDFTDRLSNVYSVNAYLKKEPEILADIEKILKAKSEKPIVSTLTEMYGRLTKILNEGTKEKMEEVGLKVVPH